MSRRRRPAGQGQLFDPAPPVIDEPTREVGQEGVAAVKETLRKRRPPKALKPLRVQRRTHDVIDRGGRL